MTLQKNQNLIVIGRGIVGLSIGYEMCQRGWQVTVIGPEERHGTASHAAVGVSSLKGHILPTQALFLTKLKGHEYLPKWIATIERDSGLKIPQITSGVVEPFFDAGGYAYLTERIFHGRFQGCLRARMVGLQDQAHEDFGTHVLKQAPRGAFYFPGDLWFDPISTLKALEQAILRFGGTIIDDVVQRVIPLSSGALRVEGEEAQRQGNEVVLAAGAFSPAILVDSGLPPIDLFLSPGETLYGPTEAEIKLNLRIAKTNIVAHGSELRWGSTSRSAHSLKAELETGPAAQGISDLWHEASRLLKPEILKREAISVRWGIRTRVRDRAPVIGPLFWPENSQHRVWVALGFYKNGLQLAGLLGQYIGQRLCGSPLSSFEESLQRLVSPQRFV